MKQWIAFWSLGTIWGSSFLLIKIAVEELGTLPLVAIRLGIAASLMLVVFRATHRYLPSNRFDLLGLIIISFTNVIIPFVLITGAEETIDSSLATVLNAAVPLFSLVFAHFALSDDRLNRHKIAGLAIGYLGILLLTWRDLSNPEKASLSGIAMMIMATVSYAFSYVFIRARLRHIEPVVVAGGALMFAAVSIIPFTLLTQSNWPDLRHLQSDTVFSIVTLAVINTVLAYFLIYYLIGEWGTRATLVTYVFPPVGIALGAIFLSEPVDASLITGAALILGGIFVVNVDRK